MRHFPFSYQMIRSAAYNLAEKTLDIEFKDGSSKSLRDITPQTYAHLMNRSLCEKLLSKFSQELAKN